MPARCPLTSARLYARSDPKARKAANDAYKKAQMYLKMKQLREARESGQSLEEYKAKLKSGDKFTSSARGGDFGRDMTNISENIKTEEAIDVYGPQKGYKKFVGARGLLIAACAMSSRISVLV